MAETSARLVVGALVLALVVVVLAGCGDEPRPEPPPGTLAPVLETVAGPTETGGLGLGWLGAPALAERRAGVPVLVDALGPNASHVVQASRALARDVGFHPLSAEEIVSVGGSYAFGIRLDGAAPGRLLEVLRRDGSAIERDGSLTLADAAAIGQVPQPLLDAGVLGLGSRVAVGPDAVVLAASDPGREYLLGDGTALAVNPLYRLASSCLGEVSAARLVPPKLLLSTELGTRLVAVGVEDPGGGAERICVAGVDPERAEARADALSQALDPAARYPRTEEPVGEEVEAATVGLVEGEGITAIRAELDLAPGRAPGLVFDLIARGTLAAWLGESAG